MRREKRRVNKRRVKKVIRRFVMIGKKMKEKRRE